MPPKKPLRTVSFEFLLLDTASTALVVSNAIQAIDDMKPFAWEGLLGKMVVIVKLVSPIAEVSSSEISIL